MKIIFMGTPDFASVILEALTGAGHEVVLAVTQPDKPKGRGKAVQFPPVKQTALAHNIEVFQPQRIRSPENVARLAGYSPDIIIVAAFGQILPAQVLELPPYGCVNVHASLMPRYRGSSPVQWAIINGDAKSGVTTMQMDEGIDTGDMLEKSEVILAPDETGGSLFDKLAQAGAKQACGWRKRAQLCWRIKSGSLSVPGRGFSHYWRSSWKERNGWMWVRFYEVFRWKKEPGSQRTRDREKYDTLKEE